ncbi:MAG: LD-carboxypeptidase [Bacteroidia bacterium]|nr:LD-carboxypeptidase [Bacteroidia bacterium]
MIKPNNLSAGDSVAIVAPAGFINPEQVSASIEILNSWGLKVVLGKNFYSKHFTFAGTDEQRLKDFQEAIDNPEIKAVFCARGGYGVIRILEKLDWSKFTKQPKWIIGYSDITVIHGCLNNFLNISSVHGPMPINFDKLKEEKSSLNSLKKLLFGDEIKYSLPNNNNIQPSNFEGKLIGGNLSILYSLRGTKYDFSSKENILFIEEIGEYMYHIDRILQNFKLGNKFSDLKGIIVGGFTEIKENDLPFAYSLLEILNEVTENKIPIVTGLSAGHITPNLPLILGSNLKVKIDKEYIELSQNQ